MSKKFLMVPRCGPYGRLDAAEVVCCLNGAASGEEAVGDAPAVAAYAHGRTLKARGLCADDLVPGCGARAF